MNKRFAVGGIGGRVGVSPDKDSVDMNSVELVVLSGRPTLNDGIGVKDEATSVRTSSPSTMAWDGQILIPLIIVVELNMLGTIFCFPVVVFFSLCSVAVWFVVAVLPWSCVPSTNE